MIYRRATHLWAALGVAGLLVAGCSAGSDAGPGAPLVPSSSFRVRVLPDGAVGIYSYAGSSTQLDVFTYPSPSPQPSTDVVMTISRTVKIVTTPNPYGSGNATDYQSQETDATKLYTQTVSGDAYYETQKAGKTSTFSLYGYSTQDDQGNRLKAAYATPQLVDRQPRTKGSSWTNDPASTVTQDTVDGNRYARTTNSDGTYTERDILYDVNGRGKYPEVIVNYSDSTAPGAATFSVDYQLRGESKTDSQRFDTVLYGGVTNGGIPVRFVQYYVRIGATPRPTPEPEFIVNAPAWYKSQPLYRERDVDEGIVRLPKSCSGATSKGVLIDRTVVQIDTALGTIETTAVGSYVVPVGGTVCVTTHSVIRGFYDYNQDWWDYPTWSPSYLWYFVGFATSPTVPLETQTFDETLYQLKTPKGIGLGAMPDAMGRAMARLESWRVGMRLRRLETIVTGMRRRTIGGT